MRGLGQRQQKEREETQRVIILALLSERQPLTFNKLFEATKALKKLSRSTFYTQLQNLLKEGIIVLRRGWYEPDKLIDSETMILYFSGSQLRGASHPIISPMIREKFKEIRNIARTKVKKLTRKQMNDILKLHARTYARWNPKRKVYMLQPMEFRLLEES
ncbi:MAG: hypothetical protein H3Z54_11410 [archaeon]|nr:hypothetical protein [archaeon]